MSTRGQVIIMDDTVNINRKGYLAKDTVYTTVLERYAYLNIYKHHDSYPEGLGKILKEFLKSDVGQGRIGDTEYFCASLFTYVADRNRQDMINTCNNTGIGIADSIHGDIEYLYLIELDKRILTCYEVNDEYRLTDNDIKFTMPF